MAIIQSGATTDLWTIDRTSKAGRVTLYDTTGYSLTDRRVTYAAGGRLAAGGGLSQATLTTQKQFLTIYHTGSSTKIVKIRKAWVHISNSSTTSTQIAMELMSLTSATAPATGNPAITPMPFNVGSAAAEAAVLCLPTTAGSTTSTATGIGTVVLFTGAITAPTTNAGVPTVIMLYDDEDALTGHEQPTMRAANAEGWAIALTSQTSSTVVASCGIIFTEE